MVLLCQRLLKTIKKIFPDNKSIYAYFKVKNGNLKLVDITNGTIRKGSTKKSNTQLSFKKGDILITENGTKFKFDKIVYRDKNSEAWGYYFKENGELDTTYALISDFDTFEYKKYNKDKTNY